MKVEVNLKFNVVDEGKLRDQARLIYALTCEDPDQSETLSLEEIVTDVIVGYDEISLYQRKTLGWLDLGLERISS